MIETLFLITLFMVNVHCWTHLATGTEDSVSDLLFYNQTNLFVAGYFHSAGNKSETNKIASWSLQNSSWHSIEGGVAPNSNVIFRIASFPEKNPNGFVAVGYFPGIMIFQFSQGWKYIHSTLSEKYTRVVVNDSEIWVTNGKAIHKYDTVSENWIVMGTVIDDINDLHKSEAGHIYVGGFFSKIGNLMTKSIARYHATSKQLQFLEGGFLDPYSEITVIESKGEDVFVGGTFEHVGSAKVKNIAKWSERTHTWTALSPENAPSTQILSIAFFQNEIWVGGNFERLGKNECLKLASYSNGNWKCQNVLNISAINSLVFTGKSKNSLFIGGVFEGNGNILQFDAIEEIEQEVEEGEENSANSIVPSIFSLFCLIFVSLMCFV